ncbi:MAG TPA: hypothetical protein DEQ62_11270 [Verrucomicrobiales bacterium]|nr:hypothetical protein [Verrucomicrobiales bacterium]
MGDIKLQDKPEKPFLIQHLIVHGVLAAILLVGGWLFPVQYKTLHPRVLAHAGKVSDDSAKGAIPQTISELHSAYHTNSLTGASEVASLLFIAKRQLEDNYNPDDPLQNKLTSGANAIDYTINPQTRAESQQKLLSSGTVSRELLNLKTATPDYEAQITLLGFLESRRKLHSKLRAELLHLQTTKQTNQLEQVMHSVTTLGLRLGFYQLAELTERVSSARTFMQLSKIAKLQTIVYPFDTFSKADGLISRDELGGTALVSTNHFTRIAGADQRIDPEEWKTIDFGKLNIVDQEFAHYDNLGDYLTVDHLQNKSPLGRNILFNQYSGADGKISRDEWREIGFIPLQYTEFPAVYAAILWSDDPDRVVQYLMTYGRPGDDWLQAALGNGHGALTELLDKQLPLSSWNTPAPGAVAQFAFKRPALALTVKYILMALGCFVLMRAWNSYFILSAADHETLHSYRLRRRALTAALCLTLIIISEPAFFQPVHSSEYQVAVNVPELGELNPEPSDTNETNNKTDMETNIILSAVIFVLFGAIQVFVFQTCVNKIREIRRGEGDPNLKLRLLENEDNLFDMGLYIGIAGTALTLAVMILMPAWNISISVAYASNIFGILCVALVKITHVRPARESLLIEAQEQA